MTISRTSALTSQFPRLGRTRRPASRATRDGWAARPAMPKSSAVLTRPVPKNICQKRLTITRPVSGCSGSTSQRARPSRLGGASFGKRRQARRHARPSPSRRACRTGPRIEHEGVARLRHLLHDHRRRDLRFSTARPAACFSCRSMRAAFGRRPARREGALSSSLDSRSPRPAGRASAAARWRGQLEHGAGVALGAVEAVLGHVVEEGVELVILLLRDRVELVVVALGAADGQAEPDGAGGVDAVDDVGGRGTPRGSRRLRS